MAASHQRHHNTHVQVNARAPTSGCVWCPQSSNGQNRQQTKGGLPERGFGGGKWAPRTVLDKFTSGESWAKATHNIWGAIRGFHRPQDRGLDSAQVVQQLSAGSTKITALPRFSASPVEQQQETWFQSPNKSGWREDHHRKQRCCALIWHAGWNVSCVRLAKRSVDSVRKEEAPSKRKKNE